MKAGATGAALMVMVIDGLIGLGAVPLEAVTMKVNGSALVGVPDRTPVLVFKVKPAGSDPLETEKVGAGLPLAVKV